MSAPTIRLSINAPAKPPLSEMKLIVLISRLVGIDTLVIWDHFQDLVPQVIWHEGLFWQAKDRPLVHEHFDYQTMLGYLAGRAGNLRLAVGVTEPLRRHPVLIAQAALTLSHMTKRATVLGIGAGERENIIPYGISSEKPVGKVEEALQIIRRCFESAGTFDFDGEHFKLKNAVMDLQPPAGKTPRIWVAAHGPRMLRLTGQYGDGWYPIGLETPEIYGDLLSTIRNHAVKAGRDPQQIEPTLNITGIITPTDDDAREIMRSPAAKIIGVHQPDHIWNKFGLTHPFGEGFGGFVDILPEEIAEEDLHAAMDAVPYELIEETTFWGSPEKLAREIRRFGDAGLRNVIMLPASIMSSPKMLRYLPRGLWSLRRKLA